MPNSHVTSRHRLARRPRGLLLIEAVISLAICAALLTAVCVGFVAASDAIRTNDEFSHATQTARVVLVQLTEQIRKGTPDANLTRDPAGNLTQFHLMTFNGADFTYKYDPDAREILLYNNAAGTKAGHVLARNITSCKLTADTGTDASGLACVTQVALTLTVTVGKNQITLSGSAAPRKSLQH
jgi:Tfp pilus assembly protein PilW